MRSAVAEFPAEIDFAVRNLRGQCRSTIESVCGSGPRAKDVADAFGVHAKLGWQLWSVAYAPSASTLRHLPNSSGLRLWLEAAAQHGVHRELIDGFERAVELLAKTMELHAADREMFEMILDSHFEDADEDIELRWRKQSFSGNSFIFGARAKCILSTVILFPSSREDYLDMVRLNGLYDLVRTRAGKRWPFASLVVQHDGNQSFPGREPIDPSATEVPLLARYCSQPLPAIERRVTSDGLWDDLLPGPVGMTGAGTVVTGEIVREIGPVYASVPGDVVHFGTGIRTPSELLVSDHIVHKSLFPGVRRELRVYGELISTTSRDEADRIEVSEELLHLGRGLLRVRTADVPAYADMLAECFKRIEMVASEFDVFRVAMRYPPLPASVMVRHEYPTRDSI